MGGLGLYLTELSSAVRKGSFALADAKAMLPTANFSQRSPNCMFSFSGDPAWDPGVSAGTEVGRSSALNICSSG